MPASAPALNNKHLIEDMGLSYFLSNYRNLLCKIDDVYYKIMGVSESNGGYIYESWHNEHNDLTRAARQTNGRSGMSDDMYFYNFINHAVCEIGRTVTVQGFTIDRPSTLSNTQILLDLAKDALEAFEDEEEPVRFYTYTDEDGDDYESDESSDEWLNWEERHEELRAKINYYRAFIAYVDTHGGPKGLDGWNDSSTQDDDGLEKLWIVCFPLQRELEATLTYIHASKLTTLAQFPRFRKEINYPPNKSIGSYPYKTRGLEVTQPMMQYPEYFLNPEYPTDLKEVIKNMRGETVGYYNGWKSVIMESGIKVFLITDYGPDMPIKLIEITLEGKRLALINPDGRVQMINSALRKYLQ